MGLFDMLQLRKEMQKRTNQIIECSKSWGIHASELVQALDRVTAALEKSEAVDLNTKKILQKTTRALNTDTKKLATALGRHEKGMIRFGAMIRDD